MGKADKKLAWGFAFFSIWVAVLLAQFASLGEFWTFLLAGVGSVSLTAAGVCFGWFKAPFPIGKPVRAVALVTIIFGTTFWSSYLIARPNFDVQLRQLLYEYQNTKGETYCIIEVVLQNKGGDSPVEGWAVHYKSASLDEDVPLLRLWGTQLPVGINGKPELYFNGSDAIFRHTETIKRNDKLMGRLTFAIPGNRDDELKKGAELFVVVADQWGRTYKAPFRGHTAERIDIMPTD